MNTIQYNIHLLLISKHKILITLLVYFIFYITLKNTHLAYCMTEGNDLPSVAEAKSIVPETKIHRIIDSYLEPAREIEQLKNDLEIQQAKAQNAYDAAGRFQKDYWAEVANGQKLKYQHQELIESSIKEKSELENSICHLHKEADASKADYEYQIRKLTNKINRQKLEIRELRKQLSEYYIDPGKY